MGITDALSPAHSVQPLQTADRRWVTSSEQLRGFGGI